MFQLPNYILLKNIQWKKLCKFSRTAGKIVNRVDHMGFNPFVTNVHILYTLKTPENQRCFQGVWNGDICQKWVKYTLTHSFPMHPFSTLENNRKPWLICSQSTLSQHNFSNVSLFLPSKNRKPYGTLWTMGWVNLCWVLIW